MDDETRIKLSLWLDSLKADDPLRVELLTADDEDIRDRFYKSLTFGTAGLRGKMGAGTNRMNRFTVAQASRGFGEYLRRGNESPSIAVAYDTRIGSRDFALLTARVMARLGIKVYMYPEAMPTPMLSFAVRRLNCSGGVMITASHNPKEYNGYKAYGPDGSQIDEDCAARILGYIVKEDLFSSAEELSPPDDPKIVPVPESVCHEFYKLSADCVIEKDAISQADLKILYTPLNGTGLVPVRTVLASLGVKNFTVVSSQEKPDGNFPTCPRPNPEINEAFSEAVALAKTDLPDIIIATDPDSDRMACAEPYNGSFQYFTGNEIGILFIDYELSRRAEHLTVPKDPFVVKSIVSSPLADMAAEYYGCRMESVLTGFKNIAGKLREHENKGDADCFILGYEESIGYQFGLFVRDKDAVTSTAKLVEMASWYKMKGLTLRDALESIYERLGFCVQKNTSFYYEGEKGGLTMAGIMDTLRRSAPGTLGGKTVLSVTDYLSGRKTDIIEGQVRNVDIPRSNVLIFTLEDDCSVIVRPSGTEPKLKLYCSAISPERESANDTIEKIYRDMESYCKV